MPFQLFCMALICSISILYDFDMPTAMPTIVICAHAGGKALSIYPMFQAYRGMVGLQLACIMEDTMHHKIPCNAH